MNRAPTSSSTAVTLFLVIFATATRADTLHVPADFATIQGCINAAISGADECVVAAGTYPATVDFLGKAVALRSSDGPTVTTIDATGLNESAIKCVNGEDVPLIVEGPRRLGSD